MTKHAPLILAVMLMFAGCKSQRSAEQPSPPTATPLSVDASIAEDVAEVPADPHATERHAMVESQIVERGVADERVLDAMRSVPRHELVPESHRHLAYRDGPLPIGHNQTISQPYIVAVMTEVLGVQPGQRVLEIGTGSGYQAAVLAAMGVKVYTIEIVCPLAERARADLDRLGYGDQVVSKCGDGYVGWAEHAPFDAVIVTAAPPEIPQPLIDQLAPGGRLVVPEGEHRQELVVIEKADDGKTTRRELFGVRFVPMVRGED